MKKLFNTIALVAMLYLPLAANEYIVLIDYSPSIKKPDQKIYQRTLGSVLGKLKSGDRISLVNVGENDITSFNFFEELQLEKGSTNKVKLHNKKGLKRLWKNFLHKPFQTEKETKIISSIRGSTQRFNTSEQKNKILIILSDMVDSTGEANAKDFYYNKNCNSVQTVVQNIDKPDLRGIKVYVAGAGGNDDKGYKCLRAFWKEFFVQSGVSKSDIVYQHLNPFN